MRMRLAFRCLLEALEPRFGPSQIPVKAFLARHFGVFNKLYTAAPTASSPNHLFTQSASSCGMATNALYPDCGGNGTYFPQPTIYDSLRLHNAPRWT